MFHLTFSFQQNKLKDKTVDAQAQSLWMRSGNEEEEEEGYVSIKADLSSLVSVVSTLVIRCTQIARLHGKMPLGFYS